MVPGVRHADVAAFGAELGNMGSVFVTGSINLDLVAVADSLPRPGQTLLGRDFARHPGGKGANQAVASARLGARTALVGKVGADPFGAELRAFLSAQGVDTSRVGTAEVATGVALILVDRAGENSIVVVPGANGCLTPEDVSELPFATGDVALSQFETPAATVERFLVRARENGATTVLNPAPALLEHAELLELADILLLNESELALFSGTPTLGPELDDIFETAARVRRRTDQQLIVTLGSRGALAIAGALRLQVHGYAVTAIDTTGAGDTFAGALAAKLAEQSTLAHALGAANAAAAYSVQRAGAATSSPTTSELAEFVAAAGSV